MGMRKSVLQLASVTLSMLIAGVGALLMIFMVPATSQAIEQKPNIVLINADDLSLSDYHRIGVLSSATGGKGLTFNRGYVTTSLCCPSRASTLTGRYVHNHGVRRHVGEGTGAVAFQNLGADKSTVATWLDGAGYETALVGKYLNGYEAQHGTPPGWDNWYATLPGWRLSENDAVKEYSQDRTQSGYRHWEDVLGDKSTDVIKNKGDAPLFLYYAPHAPHSPEVWPPRHDGHFTTAKLPTGGAYNERDVTDKPSYIRKLPLITDRQHRNWTKKHRARLRSTLSVADQIHRIERALKAKGELDNTVFIFTSDNGYHMGQHRLTQGKQTPYETDHRVPLAVWGKGVERGARNHYVLNTDLAPTIVDLAGATIPKYETAVDGRSFTRLLTTNPPATDYRAHFVVEGYHGLDVKVAIVPPTYHVLYSVAQRYTYTRYGTGEREYYDLANDPAQMRSQKLSATRRENLDRLLTRLKQCAGYECRRAEGGR